MRRLFFSAAIALVSIAGIQPTLGDLAPRAQAADKQKSNITMTRIAGAPNTYVSITVTLTDSKGNPIRNREVAFIETSARGTMCVHGPTNTNGQYVWNSYKIQPLGNPTTIKALFNGDSIYYSDSITRKVNITN